MSPVSWGALVLFYVNLSVPRMTFLVVSFSTCWPSAASTMPTLYGCWDCLQGHLCSSLPLSTCLWAPCWITWDNTVGAGATAAAQLGSTILKWVRAGAWRSFKTNCLQACRRGPGAWKCWEVPEGLRWFWDSIENQFLLTFKKTSFPTGNVLPWGTWHGA